MKKKTFNTPDEVLDILGPQQGAVVTPLNGSRYFAVYGDIVDLQHSEGKNSLNCLEAGANHIHGKNNVFVFKKDKDGQQVSA